MAAAQMPHLILASGSVVPRRVRPVGVSSFVRPGNCMATQYSHRRCQLPVLTNISHDRQRCFVRTYALEADTEPEAQCAYLLHAWLISWSVISSLRVVHIVEVA